MCNRFLCCNEIFQRWMHSIHWYSGCNEAESPPVVLVGTFKDKLADDTAEEEATKRTNALLERFARDDDPAHDHLKDLFKLSNDKIEMEQVRKLKQRILGLAEDHLKNWGKPIPATWLLLLRTLKSQGKRVLDMKEVIAMNEGMVANISSKEGLLLCLRYYHEVGELMFYDEDDLRHKVIVDLQLYIDALKSIFCSEEFCLKKSRTARLWFALHSKGELSEELIDCVWENTEDLKRNKDVLIAYMARSHVIAELEMPSTDQKNGGRRFLAPCGLDKAVPISIRDDLEHATQLTSTLCFVSKKHVLPAAVFHRLIAACLQDSTWTIAQGQEDNLIFSDFVQLQLNETNFLQLFHKEPTIQMRVVNYAESKDEAFPKLVFEKVQESILKITRLLNVTNGQEDSLFDLCFKCKEASLDKVYNLRKYSQSAMQSRDTITCELCSARHPLKTADLTGDWLRQLGEQTNESETVSTHDALSVNLEELVKTMLQKQDVMLQKQDQTLQKQNETYELLLQGEKDSKAVHALLLEGQRQIITKVAEIESRQSGLKQDELNVLRLHTAISSVCTDMMCAVMLKTVPNDDVNFYSKITSHEPELQKSALSKEQKNKLFQHPRHPNGIGIVQQYDITGLYAIIRNISTVRPELEVRQRGRIVSKFAESRPPSDNPRDVSTGANVERIKNIRNVFKHSNDLTISDSDLKDKWDAVEAIAEDLDKAGFVDGPKCKADLTAIENKYKAGKPNNEFKDEYKKVLEEIKGYLDTIMAQLPAGNVST